MKSPVYNVQAIPVEKIQANTYNPNHVAPPEMKLLYDSIKEDGYTMPIVCYYLPDVDKYEIVDGFHRYTVMLTHKDIYEREGGSGDREGHQQSNGQYRETQPRPRYARR